MPRLDCFAVLVAVREVLGATVGFLGASFGCRAEILKVSWTWLFFLGVLKDDPGEKSLQSSGHV